LIITKRTTSEASNEPQIRLGSAKVRIDLGKEKNPIGKEGNQSGL